VAGLSHEKVAAFNAMAGQYAGCAGPALQSFFVTRVLSGPLLGALTASGTSSVTAASDSILALYEFPFCYRL